jgi:DUF1365 family protein
MTEAETIANAVNEMLRQMAVDRDRIEQLEAALRMFADDRNYNEWIGWNREEEPQDIARAALGEK